MQLSVTESFVANVVEPFEQQCGATVELFAFPAATTRTDLDNCMSWLDLLSEKLGRDRLRLFQPCITTSQDDGVRQALRLFRRTADVSVYSYIMMVRLDYTFTLPVIQWVDTDWSRFNFLSKCERHCGLDTPPGTCTKSGGDPPRCVNDMLHTMPGAYFSGFDLAISGPPLIEPLIECYIRDGVKECGGCFRGSDHGTGHHFCFSAIEVAIHITSGNATRDPIIGFVTAWRPQKSVREWSPIGHVN